MTKSSDTQESDDVDGLDEFKRFVEFAKDEPVVHVTRQITITREMLETAEVWDIVEPVSCKMNGVETGAQAEAVLASFSVGQRRLYAVQYYLMEVHHGGHEYFFRYSGGLVWPDALAGLEMIGATAAYEILLEATQRFPEPPLLSLPRAEKRSKNFGFFFFNSFHPAASAAEIFLCSSLVRMMAGAFSAALSTAFSRASLLRVGFC